MKTTLITRMGSFILGGGTGVAAALAGLALWTGTSDLGAIKTLVENHMTDTEQQVSLFASDYKVTVENANTEIGEYKDALAEANANIDKLITAYNNAETEHQTEVSNLQKELTSANSKYETDMKELQAEYDKMVQKINLDYKLDMNAKIEEANAIIEQANQEVGETKEYVDTVLENSRTKEQAQDRIAETGKVLDTTGDKSVQDISSIVPQE